MKTALFFTLLLLSASGISGGPIAYAICQTGCNALVVVCYAAAGFIFGTGKEIWLESRKFIQLFPLYLVTAGAATAPAILACNAGLGM